MVTTFVSYRFSLKPILRAHAEDAPSKDATVAPSVDVTSEPATRHAKPRYGPPGPPVAPVPAPVKATQQGVAWRCYVILCWQGFVWFALIRSYVFINVP